MRVLTFACALVLASASAARADVSVRAFLDRTRVAVGQSAALTIEIQGAQDAPAPALGAPDGASLRYVGPSTQVSFVNGQVTASVSHRYAVVPNRAGSFTLGPFTVSHEGRTYEAPAVALQAVPAAQAAQGVPGRDEIQVVIELPRRRAYVHERIPLTVVLYVGNTRVEDLQYPVVPAEGFTLERFSQPSQTREVRGGKVVNILRFETMLTPLRPGTVNIGPAQQRMALVLSSRRGRDPFFDGFLGDYRKEPIEVSSEAVSLEILSLPEADRPAGFQGAVGRFTLEASAKPTELRVGDPITVRVTVAGEGNLASVSPPTIDAGDGFKAYPQQEVSGSPPGQKTFEQVLIPLRDDVRELPAVRFSYFDTQTERYETLVRGPFPLQVAPSEVAQEARVVQAEGDRAVERREEELGRDIVYIKDAPGALAVRGQSFLDRPWFWIALVAPALCYLGLWVWVRRRDRLRTDPRYARFARAGREAQAALGGARGLLGAGEEARFDDALSRAVRDYLGAKLDLPPGAVEAENVARRLGGAGNGSEVARQVERVLGLLERVRYAPSGAARPEREEALRLAEEIVAALEKQRYSNGRRAAAALLVGVLLLGFAAARAENPMAAFYEGNALYARGDFDAAAVAYESVLGAGRASAAVYFNLGNAYMKSGRPGLAILNYERARRLAPADVDIRTNLSFALEEQGLETETPVWQRLALPLAERLDGGSLAALCVALWVAVLAALAVRLLIPRSETAAARAAIVLAALLVFVGSNLGARVMWYDLADDAVVTRAGETAVRFEPSADGTAHFSVAEGTLVRILERRDGWLQVARADGRRGWIDAGACEAL
jgi:tetratricopeptide (TPR) repeat protein